MDYIQSTNSGSYNLGFVVHKHLLFFTFSSQTQLSLTCPQLDFTFNSIHQSRSPTHFKYLYFQLELEFKQARAKLMTFIFHSFQLRQAS